MREMTLFDKIVSGEIPARVVWEDEENLAFLTPYPNTPGFTVLIPKKFGSPLQGYLTWLSTHPPLRQIP